MNTATTTSLEKVIEAISERGVQVELVNTGAEALRRLQEIIPSGADVMTGGSLTLRQIGFEDYITSRNHPWNYVKGKILAEQDREKAVHMRKEATLSDYFLGSPQAITESGEMLFVSAGGSQLPAYAFSSKHVIWVAGIQKIVPTLDAALQRAREVNLPAEDARMKTQGFPGSFIGKMLIFERENPATKRELRLILVNETLGI